MFRNLILAAGLVFGFQAHAYLMASPSFVNFGMVHVGGSTFESISIMNMGTGTVSLSSTSLGCMDFQINGYCGTVPQYGSCNYQVWYHPFQAGMSSCQLLVNDSNSGDSVSISIMGTGVRADANEAQQAE